MLFSGFVNQRSLPEVYAAADWLVLPSEYEPFGLVINEAFASGKPAVVSAACGAADDLVRDGETGFVVPVGDTALLSERFRTLVTNRGLLRAMGARARQRIDEWGPEQNQEAFANVCRALAARRTH
jgi:glycosyltransferase involved in cell wall biosynthesis